MWTNLEFTCIRSSGDGVTRAFSACSSACDAPNVAFKLTWPMINIFQTIGKDFGNDTLASAGRSGLCKDPEKWALKGVSVLVVIHEIHTTKWNDKKKATNVVSIQSRVSWRSSMIASTMRDPPWWNCHWFWREVGPFLSSTCGRVKIDSTDYQEDILECQFCYPQVPRTTLHHLPGKCCQNSKHISWFCALWKEWKHTGSNLFC